MWIALLIFSFLIPVIILAGIIYVIVKLVNGHKNGKKTKPFGFREIILTCLVIAAGFAGIVGFFSLPYAFVEDSSSGSESYVILATHLVCAMGLLIAGMLAGHFTGKFVMSIGIILLIASAIPALETLGSAGGFLAVIIAFFVLIAITIKVTKKADGNG